MKYTKINKTSFNGQGLTRKDDCFHGLLKDWTAEITLYCIIYTLLYKYRQPLLFAVVTFCERSGNSKNANSKSTNMLKMEVSFQELIFHSNFYILCPKF